jgi:hypothetical protein
VRGVLKKRAAAHRLRWVLLGCALLAHQEVRARGRDVTLVLAPVTLAGGKWGFHGLLLTQYPTKKMSGTSRPHDSSRSTTRPTPGFHRGRCRRFPNPRRFQRCPQPGASPPPRRRSGSQARSEATFSCAIHPSAYLHALFCTDSRRATRLPSRDHGALLLSAGPISDLAVVPIDGALARAQFVPARATALRSD